ncbi:zinc finger, C3HC4 type (RING finger) domain-containing protein [Babesia caballi]|uniref:RING-type E3 ubiquitin transferase n=1 Tax=Babesia caballi TaxID=5871 RepID=A0AAV4LV08_BABCB|nr:zinc finger, C3HC4 type (RING finger) domain-containing protein [Babesia caballi]
MNSGSREFGEPPHMDVVNHFVGPSLQRQSSRVRTSTGSAGMFSDVTGSWAHGQGLCSARNHGLCEFGTDGNARNPAAECQGRSVSRFTSIPTYPALVNRGSLPPNPFVEQPLSSRQASVMGDRAFVDAQAMRSQTTSLGGATPRLTRTQRSYINESPPSAREALTMRFIKANMTRTPSHQSGSQSGRTASISHAAVPMMRNCSAPAAAALSRTTSIQPDIATSSSNYPPRRTCTRGYAQRQISEPLGPHEVPAGPTLASLQQDIETLNRVLNDFRQNFRFTHGMFSGLPNAPQTFRMQSEHGADVHSLYTSPRSGVGQAEYREEMVQTPRAPRTPRTPRTPREGVDPGQIEYVQPTQMYYDVSEVADNVSTPRGLPDDIISQFPVTEFDPVAAEKWDEDTRRCSICLDEYEQTQLIRRLACTHGYHKECIDEWLARSTVCPICKFDYRIMLE